MATPNIAEKPPTSLLIFDGDCAFCSLWVERLQRLLPSFPASAAWQWIDLDDYALTRDDVDKAAWFVTGSRQFAGHLALSALLRSQPTIGWRFLGNLIATEPFNTLCSLAYWLVAKNRHRLPGGTPACAMTRTQ